MPRVSSRAGRRPLVALAALVVLVGIVGACEPLGQPSGSPSPAGDASSGPSPVGTETAAESVSPDESDAATDNPSTLIPVDATLLELLPVSVNGLTLEPVTDPQGADDPALADTVDRLAQAMVFDPETGSFAYVSVIALRSGVFDAAYFRSWRDSFDEGVCSQSDGVAGHAQAVIGGRTVYIGRCTGGVATYHVRLDSHNAIVSVSELVDSEAQAAASAPPVRLGELIMAGLRP